MKHFTKNNDQSGKNQNILPFNPIKMLESRIKMAFDLIKAPNSV